MEVHGPVAVFSLRLRVCLFMLRGLLGGICRSEMGELVPNFFFIRFCFMVRNKDE